MRVLLIDVNCKSSSTGQIVYNLFSFLNSHGDVAAICYGRGMIIEEKNIYKFGLDWETHVHAFLTRITGFTGCFSFFSTMRLLKFIKKYKPDVVHIHELHAYFVNIKLLLNFLAKRQIKVVHTLHCEFSYTGKCGHSVECEKWKTECSNCPHLKDYPKTLFFDHTKHMFRVKQRAFSQLKDLTIITPSSWLASRARESFFGNRSINVIHNGIDTAIFKPTDYSSLLNELKISKNEIVVLALAPNLMSREKGGEYILEIAKRFKKQPYRFVLVGVDNLKPFYEDNVIAKGRIYNKFLLAQFYSMADVFIICSERENFPTTCLEAQACGTPVVGFNTGGTAETIIGDAAKALVEYGNINKLVSLIMEVKKKLPSDSLQLSILADSKFGNTTSCMANIHLYRQ